MRRLAAVAAALPLLAVAAPADAELSTVDHAGCTSISYGDTLHHVQHVTFRHWTAFPVSRRVGERWSTNVKSYRAHPSDSAGCTVEYRRSTVAGDGRWHVLYADWTSTPPPEDRCLT